MEVLYASAKIKNVVLLSVFVLVLLVSTHPVNALNLKLSKMLTANVVMNPNAAQLGTEGRGQPDAERENRAPAPLVSKVGQLFFDIGTDIVLADRKVGGKPPKLKAKHMVLKKVSIDSEILGVLIRTEDKIVAIRNYSKAELHMRETFYNLTTEALDIRRCKGAKSWKQHRVD